MDIGTNLFLSHSKHPSQVMSAASITCRRSCPGAELCKAVGPSRSFNNRSSWSTAKLQPGQLQKPQKPEQLEQLQKVEKKRHQATLLVLQVVLPTAPFLLQMLLTIIHLFSSEPKWHLLDRIHLRRSPS